MRPSLVCTCFLYRSADNNLVPPGGGLLDLGLEQGNPLLHTSIAIEKHHVAAECFYANHDGGNIIKQTVSDVNEEVYFGRPSEALQPGELAFLSGGSPCQVRPLVVLQGCLPPLTRHEHEQGFSRLNRFKTLDDLRCAEPFVYLTSLAIFRPLHALYENVAAFETHSIPHPIPGSHDQSFFRLFVAVATSLRYQLRWSVVNAAGCGLFLFSSAAQRATEARPAAMASPSSALASSCSSPRRACACQTRRRRRTPSRRRALAAITASSTSATMAPRTKASGRRTRFRTALLTCPSRFTRPSTTCPRSTSRSCSTVRVDTPRDRYVLARRPCTRRSLMSAPLALVWRRRQPRRLGPVRDRAAHDLPACRPHRSGHWRLLRWCDPPDLQVTVAPRRRACPQHSHRRQP